MPLGLAVKTEALPARLSGLEEITRWVLSWGSKAQVLGPPALKKRVKDELIAMTNTHS